VTCDPAGFAASAEGGSYAQAMRSPHLYPIRFDAPGRYTITASFGGQTDTLLVDVAPAPSETAPYVPGPRADARTERALGAEGVGDGGGGLGGGARGRSGW